MAEGAHEARRRGRGRIAPALPMAPPSPPTPSRSPRQMLFGTLTGRLFLAASIVKLVTVVIDRTTGAPTLVSAVGTLAGLIIVITALVFGVRATGRASC